MTPCPGSVRRVIVSSGQMEQTAGYMRPNRARNVRCPDCGRVFDTARITYMDHGIPTGPTAIVPTHKGT
jgi:hypothetical protein